MRKLTPKPLLGDNQELNQRREMLNDAMSDLNEREQRIFTMRRLSEDPMTLEQLSKEFGVSRERIRQIEVRAFEKVQKSVTNAAAATAAELRLRTQFNHQACKAGLCVFANSFRHERSGCCISSSLFWLQQGGAFFMRKIFLSFTIKWRVG